MSEYKEQECVEIEVVDENGEKGTLIVELSYICVKQGKNFGRSKPMKRYYSIGGNDVEYHKNKNIYEEITGMGSKIWYPVSENNL